MSLASIVLLLQVALGLLVNAQAPGVAVEVRNQAIEYAGSAVNLAVQALGISVSSSSTSTPGVPEGGPSIVAPPAPIAPPSVVTTSTVTRPSVVGDIGVQVLANSNYVNFPNVYELQATGEPVRVEAIVVNVSEKDKGSLLPSFGLPLGKSGEGIIDKLHVFSCDAAQWYTSSTLAYPCPSSGYVAVAKDWQGFQRFNLILTLETSYRIEVPETGSLVYVRGIGVTDGRVIEKSL